MAKILTSRNISTELRSRIAKCYIWSTFLYGAETWTLTKVTSDKLEAFEMWLYRRMFRISWKEHKTNGEVLYKMKTKRSLLNTIKKRKCQYFGHIVRGNGVQRLLMEGRINGRRGRGRPRTMWTDNIKEWTKYHIMTVSEWHKIENDEDPWQPTCWLQMAHNDDDDGIVVAMLLWVEAVYMRVSHTWLYITGLCFCADCPRSPF